MAMKGILSIDPGGTSGLAWRMPDGRYLTSVGHSPSDVWEQVDPKIISEVVYENYAGQLISGAGLLTVRIIGGIQALCELHGIKVWRHPPQVRKAFLASARVYLAKNKDDTFVVHEVDALAHLMAWEHNHERKH